MAYRAFKTAFLFLIDETALPEPMPSTTPESVEEATLHQVKEYLRRALTVEIDDAAQGEALKFQSGDVLVEQLVELTDTELHNVYKTPGELTIKVKLHRKPIV